MRSKQQSDLWTSLKALLAPERIGFPGEAIEVIERIEMELDDAIEKHRTIPQSKPRVPKPFRFLLHLAVPRRDREVVERDLDELLEQEAHHPEIGPIMAKLAWCLRASQNIAWYGWHLVPKWLRRSILGALTTAALKSLGLLPTLEALRSGGWPWK